MTQLFPYFRILCAVILLFAFACQPAADPKAHSGMALIPGGSYEMGANSDQAYHDEFPVHKVEVSAFYMDTTEVTNAQFLKFVEATGYKTIAEREIDWEVMKKDLPPGTPKPSDSLLNPGSLVFKPTSEPVNLNEFWHWWEWKIGANWRMPEGPGSSIEDRMDHPVVQIAWEDAVAYAEWAGKRLPTEAEWEWAAMGGKQEAKYPWGEEDIALAVDKANFWQGVFPVKNYELDGFARTSPVASYPPNGYGLYDMAGNVWEYCQDKYNVGSYEADKEKGVVKNPTGAVRAYDPNEPYVNNKYIIRGGSFLCNESYCSGYRTSRRMPAAAESSANHQGFRCVRDI